MARWQESHCQHILDFREWETRANALNAAESVGLKRSEIADLPLPEIVTKIGWQVIWKHLDAKNEKASRGRPTKQINETEAFKYMIAIDAMKQMAKEAGHEISDKFAIAFGISLGRLPRRSPASIAQIVSRHRRRWADFESELKREKKDAERYEKAEREILTRRGYGFLWDRETIDKK